MIESVFRDFLLKSPALAALVGTSVFQDRAPQNAATPLIVLRKLRSDSTQDMAFLPGHAETRYRVLSSTLTFTELVAVREALKGLDGYSIANASQAGFDTDFNTAGTVLQSAMVVFEADQFEESAQLFFLTMDWVLMHTETFTPGLSVP